MKMNLTHFEFPDHTHPKGRLPNDKRAQACWYFYLQAQKVKEMVGDSIEDQQFRLLEGDLWLDKRYEQQARTIAMLYGLDSPDEFMKFWEYVIAEAADSNLPAPSPEYMRPLRIVIN